MSQWDPGGWGPPLGQHASSARTSPRWVVGLARPNQSAGHCFALISIRRRQLRVNQKIEVNFVFITWVYYVLSPGAQLWNTACVHPLVGLGGGQKKWIFQKHNMAPTNKKRLQDNDQDSDSDSENEHSYNSYNNWPRFLVVESSSDDLPLSKLSPFAVQKGFQAVAKSIKRLMDGSFLVECGKRAQAQNLLRTNRFIDRPVRVSVHKTLNSSQGVIRCQDLANMTEVEIRDELKDQGVVGVNRVTLKKKGKVIPPPTLFSWRSVPRNPERDHGWLSKGEGGLVCSEPYALLQLQLVWTYEPTLQGCCTKWHVRVLRLPPKVLLRVQQVP